MFAFTVGARTPTADATGAKIGHWIDGHFTLAVAVAIGVAVLLAVTVGLLLRAYGRQRRRNRRLRRQHEAVLARQLGVLQRHVDELRVDVRQLAELQDHVVGQLQLIHSSISPADDAGFSMAWTAPAEATAPAGSGAWSAPRRELVGSSAAEGGTGSGRWREQAPPRPAALDLREPAMLVETGEPMEWATRQP